MPPPKTSTRSVKAFRLENALWEAAAARYAESDYENFSDWVAAALTTAAGEGIPPRPPGADLALVMASAERMRAVLGRCRAVFERLLAAYRIDPARYRSVEEAAKSLQGAALWTWCGWWEVRGYDLPLTHPKKPRQRR